MSTDSAKGWTAAELGGVQLDRRSGIPLYVQAAGAIERLVRLHPSPPGVPLPPEGDLAQALGISRPTLRQAIRYLVERHVVTVRRGVGSFAMSGVLTRPSRMSSLYSDLDERGLAPSTNVLSLTLAPIDPETAVALATGFSEVFQIERIRFASGLPIAIMETTVVKLPGLELTVAELESSSLYGLIQAKTGTFPTHGKETVSAHIAGQRQRDLLGLTGAAALLLIRRISFDAHGRGVERSSTWYVNTEVDIPLDARPTPIGPREQSRPGR